MAGFIFSRKVSESKSSGILPRYQTHLEFGEKKGEPLLVNMCLLSFYIARDTSRTHTHTHRPEEMQGRGTVSFGKTQVVVLGFGESSASLSVGELRLLPSGLVIHKFRHIYEK
jgi:hypothetical protein